MTATPEAQGQVLPLPGDPAYVTARPANPAGLPTAYEHGGRLTPEGSTVDPILVEIVQGTLASVEMEVETAIGRTSRSPMIRDAHDFRAGIHDRQLRKLTGRSYSALVHPVKIGMSRSARSEYESCCICCSSGMPNVSPVLSIWRILAIRDTSTPFDVRYSTGRPL